MNTQLAIDFLKEFRGSELIVLSAISEGHITTETFTFPEACRDFIDANNGVKNLYFTVNPVRGVVNKKPAKTDILYCSWLYVDCDPVGDATTFEAERKAILARLESFEPKPTYIIDSGGGYQAYWKLETPVLLSSLDMISEMEAYNIQLELLLQGDHTHNIDRIMRLPGTVNIPTKKKLEKGRNPAESCIVSQYNAAYPIARFMKSPSLGQAVSLDMSGNLAPVEIDALPAEVTDYYRTIIVGGRDVDPAKYPSDSEAYFGVIRHLLNAKVSPDAILSILLDPRYKIGRRIQSHRRPVEEGMRQIKRCIVSEQNHPDKLVRMNDTHALVLDGGKARVLNERMVDGFKEITFSSIPDFKAYYMNDHIQLDEKFMEAGKWWLQHKDRRQYDRVIFHPNNTSPNSYNLWTGFGVEPIPGDCSLFKQHIMDNICIGNQEYYDYLMNWMARAVQIPDEPGRVAVVLRGNKGVGKGCLFNYFGRIFGSHFIHLTNQSHIVGKFNKHLAQAVFVFGDEAFFAGDKQGEAVMKGLITEDHLMVEAKGIDAILRRNFVHLGMASNSDWVVPTSANERRFFVLDVADAKMQNLEYFKPIYKEMESGGLEAFFYELLTRDISNYEVRTIPSTVALNEQKKLSWDVHTKWWFDKLSQGYILPSTSWKDNISVDLTYTDYLQYVREMRQGRPYTKQEMGIFLAKCNAGQGIKRKQLQTTNAEGRSIRGTHYVLPPLEEMRQHFTRKVGVPLHWEPILDEDDVPF